MFYVEHQKNNKKLDIMLKNVYNLIVQRYKFESGQIRKKAALRCYNVCTYFFNVKTKSCLGDKMLDELYKLNQKAIKCGDVPVSCIILKDSKIVSKAYNQRIKKNDPLGHAEIIAIKKASKKLKTWNLNDCELYVSLKPCKMCEEIINEARIKHVYYIIDSDKEIHKTVDYKKLITNNELENKFKTQLKQFFTDKR